MLHVLGEHVTAKTVLANNYKILCALIIKLTQARSRTRVRASARARAMVRDRAMTRTTDRRSSPVILSKIRGQP